MMKIAFPHPPGSGGPGSFQKRFEEQLLLKGFKIVYADSTEKPDIIFIVGGTGRIFWLIRCKLNGIPIIYRLDGIQWLHRKKKAWRSFKHFLTFELHNILSKSIHAFLADYIIYQSNFVKDWWDRSGWRKARNYSIIYNAVDLNKFYPDSNRTLSPVKLICLEGLLDYSPYAIDLINEISKKNKFEFLVYGGIKFAAEKNRLLPEVKYMGTIGMHELPEVYRNTIYLSLDVNAACPNTVVEALASGAPVVGFDTGSLFELVKSNGGLVVPYGSDPWELGYPDAEQLLLAIDEVYKDYDSYSSNARKLAEENYSIDRMVNHYLSTIELMLNSQK